MHVQSSIASYQIKLSFMIAVNGYIYAANTVKNGMLW